MNYFAFIVAALLLSHAVRASDDDIRSNRVENGLLPIAATHVGIPASIQDRMRAYGIPGLSVAVIENGRIAWAKGYGIANSKSGRAVDTHTLFQAASISKPISAMGVLALVRKGRLLLDEPANDALRSWKIPESDLTRNQPVTIRMLLNHTAGLEHSTPELYEQFLMGDPLPSMVQVLSGAAPSKAGPVFAVDVPGKTFSYSGTGYEVLQQILLDASGESFEQYMQSAVLEPIGMHDSTFLQELPAATLANTATGNLAGGNPLPGRFYVGPSLTVAGLWTTPTDVAKYIINVQQTEAGHSNEPLGQDLVREMLKPGLGNRALGPAISGSGPNVRFGHDGFNEGFESSFVAYVNGDRGAVVMTNSGFSFMLIKEVLSSISRVYHWPDYGATTQQPPSAAMGQQRVTAVSAEVLAASPGEYGWDDVKFALLRRGNRLFIDWPDNGLAEVFATADGRYFCTQLAMSNFSPYLRFVRGAGGTVVKILAGDGGRIELRRLN